MSEYQYYEFAAVDGPISDEGLQYARGCSSRASVSRMRWQNTYTFGDFHGSVDTLLKYYDVHFYIANWGSVCLALAFPRGALSLEAMQPYLQKGRSHETTLTVREIGDRCIVRWERYEEGGWSWTDGEGLMDKLMGIREELLRADYRALFLGWLADFHPEMYEDSPKSQSVMPPIPAGLAHLSPAQKALVKQFSVDKYALAAAAGLSQASTAERIPMASVLEGLAAADMRALLARVAAGGGPGVMNELNRLTHPRVQSPAGQPIKCMDFAARTMETRELTRKKEAEAAAVKRRRDAELRRHHLASILARADTLWSEIDLLMDQKIASAYDGAASQLEELRDAYVQAGATGDFQQKLTAFRSRYSNRPAMLRRIKEL